MTIVRRLGLLSVLWVFVACSGDSDSTGSINTTDGSQQTSLDTGSVSPGQDVAAVDPSSDAALPSSDGSEGPDEHVAECEASADCAGTDTACSCRGECVDVSGKNPCTEPKNCGSGSWCDPCTGHCQPVVGLCEPCSASGLCGVDGTCRNLEDAGCADLGVCIPFASGGSYCGSACLSSAGCPNGYECVEVDGAAEKQCVPTSGACSDLGLCGSDSDCPEGEVCLEGPQVCGPGCMDDGACPVPQVCDNARCVDPCSSDADCVLPELCNEVGHCKDPNACESWTECPPEHYCHKDDGQCVPGCQLDEQCADAAKVCDSGTCVAKGCEHNYQCAFEEECAKTSGDCGPMTRPHCSVCDASVDDPAQCGGDPNLCVTFQDDEGAEVGDYCLLTCDADPIDACPQGYGCEHIEAPDAGIDGYFCVRQCWQDPIGG